MAENDLNISSWPFFFFFLELVQFHQERTSPVGHVSEKHNNLHLSTCRRFLSHVLSASLCVPSDEGELMSSMSVDEGSADVVPLRSKTNPFQDVPHDRKAVEVKEGLLQRKIHADVDGKRSEFLFW